MIVHQPRSSTGDVGMKLRERGYELDVRRPVIGEKLPQSMDEHDIAVIYGGPPSANDDLDYIKYEIDWISTALLSNKPFLGICLGIRSPEHTAPFSRMERFLCLNRSDIANGA